MELVEEKEITYQSSALGKIPSDWIAATFGEVLTGFSSGMTPYRAIREYYSGNIPWITSGELNYNVITDTWEHITPEAVVKTNLKLLPVGTFLMAITGLEAAGTRGSCAITGVKATTNQSCMALFPIEGKTTTEYLYHFYVHYGNELAFKFCQGTKQQSYTGRIARRLPINLPPTLHEQQAIAQVLSDTDKLIQSLEKKIAKKKLIKQGVMQQLLSGKTRLNGFAKSNRYKQTELGLIPEDWLMYTVGDLIELLTDFDANGSFSSVAENVKVFDREEFAWYVRSTDLENDTPPTHVRYVDKKSYQFLKKTALYGNELLFLKRGEIGSVYLFKMKTKHATVAPNLYLLKLNEVSNSGYLYYFFKSEAGQKQLKSKNASSTLGALYKADVKSILVPLPSTLEEQKAIAQVLSDMDSEITKLSGSLRKVKQAKQGMMQQLLTGKIRLV